MSKKPYADPRIQDIYVSSKYGHDHRGKLSLLEAWKSKGLPILLSGFNDPARPSIFQPSIFQQPVETIKSQDETLSERLERKMNAIANRANDQLDTLSTLTSMRIDEIAKSCRAEPSKEDFFDHKL